MIKKTGKFTPIEQWVHHEDVALVTDAVPSNTSPAMGSRYDDQIAVLGKDFMARVRNMKIFMVGCGALGCEYLKGLAMMGACAGNDGKLWVTDMDIIEVQCTRVYFCRVTPCHAGVQPLSAIPVPNQGCGPLQVHQARLHHHSIQ